MIRLHHLRIGRSVFTVWLLEELELSYELTIYDRDPKTMRAGDDLKAAHPLGKSPVLEDGALKIAESAAIATYLVETYDRDGLLAPPRTDRAAWTRYLEWLHYPEGSAFAPLLLQLLLSREKGEAPMISAFAAGETKRHLDHISASLGEKPYILGDALQTPDIGVGYIANMAARLGLLENHPIVAAYAKRCTERPAFQRAVARSGG